MISLQAFFGYLLVGVLWGCTNPYMKHAQAVSNQNRDSKENKLESKSIVGNIRRMIKDYKLIIPFACNQCGSVVFYFLLSSQPISIASPVCNSLSFLFTAITSYFVFHEVVKHPVYLLAGTLLILLGTVICMSE
jgi:drug/metabolite transporter (DMT)-like permease